MPKSFPTQPSRPTPSDFGARYQWLPNASEAYRRMLETIGAARVSIRLEIYIFTDSPAGGRFREALVDAARRGVKVTVLVDAWGSVSLPASYWDPLHAAGGGVVVFNPLGGRGWAIRNHRKLLVCDDAVAVVGGFNIGSEFEGDGLTGGWFDLGVLIRGDLARELGASFDRLLGLAGGDTRPFVRLRKTNTRRRVTTNEGTLLLGGPGRGRNHFTRYLMDDLRRAPSIRIMSAYFLPTLALRRAFVGAARHGRRVQIILPGLTDVPMAKMAASYFYPHLLRNGVELYEYQPRIFHAKLFLMGGVVYAGSANLDKRSLHINHELLVRIEDSDFAKKGEAIFEETLALSRRLDLGAWLASVGLWVRIKQLWAYFLLARLDPFFSKSQFKISGHAPRR